MYSVSVVGGTMSKSTNNRILDEVEEEKRRIREIEARLRELRKRVRG